MTPGKAIAASSARLHRVVIIPNFIVVIQSVFNWGRKILLEAGCKIPRGIKRKRESEAPLSGLSKSSQYKYRALYKYK